MTAQSAAAAAAAACIFSPCRRRRRPFRHACPHPLASAPCRSLRRHVPAPPKHHIKQAPPDSAAASDAARALLAARRAVYGPNATVAYAATSPLHVVRGDGAYLFDAAGRRYLDCINNVAHVGHSNAAVRRAVAAQMGAVNTNARYLSAELVAYSEELLALLPPHLEVGKG